MVENDPLWSSRRPGGILQERERVAVDVRHFPLLRLFVAHFVGCMPVERLQKRRFVDQFVDQFQNGVCCQRGFGGAVLSDCLNSFQRTVAARRIDRHSRYAGVKASKERSDKVQSRREEQHRFLADHVVGLEPGGYGAGAAVEFRIRPFHQIIFAVFQKSKSNVVRLMTGAMAKQVYQSRRSKERSR